MGMAFRKNWGLGHPVIDHDVFLAGCQPLFEMLISWDIIGICSRFWGVFGI